MAACMHAFCMFHLHVQLGVRQCKVPVLISGQNNWQNISAALKIILCEVAGGIKTTYSMPSKTRLLVMNILLLTHLQHPAVYAECLSLTLEKQLNWEIQACFNITKYISSSNLTLKHVVLSIPVKLLLRIRAEIYTNTVYFPLLRQ